MYLFNVNPDLVMMIFNLIVHLAFTRALKGEIYEK
tara:strand:- start:293 stop:397 length:105 start_codon:yes stop_codon:yes gene_type:complete